jgi:hypothetical protein
LIFFLVAPILRFNRTSSLNVTLDQSIGNLSFFFNTIQSNGILFVLSSTIDRNLSATHRQLIGRLVDGRLRLYDIDQGQQRLNDGRAHRVQIDIERHRLSIDRIERNPLTSIKPKFVFNRIEFLADQLLDGWLQDIRINNQLLPVKENVSSRTMQVHRRHIQLMETNPCYPDNPCEHQGICQVTHIHQYT